MKLESVNPPVNYIHIPLYIVPVEIYIVQFKKKIQMNYLSKNGYMNEKCSMQI